MTRAVILSDIHFGVFSRTNEFVVPGEKSQDDSTGDLSLEKGLIELIKEKKPTFIFIAGDLTSVASPQEFYYCKEKINAIADACGILKENVICCLGNHDIDWKITNLAEEACKDIELDDVKTKIKEGYQRIASFSSLCNINDYLNFEDRGPAPYNGVYCSEEFILFVLNSGWKSGPNQEYAHGKLSREQLEWFDSVSRKYKEDCRKKIVLMHHHSFKYAYAEIVEDISQIEESAEFIDTAIKNGIDIIIHGHRHHPSIKTFQEASYKPITFLCAGSLSVNAKHRRGGYYPNTVHFIDIDKACSFFTLYNYTYTGPEGWKEMKYAPQTPLDYCMRIGEIGSKEECINEIKKYSDKDIEVIVWENLPHCMKLLLYNEASNMFYEQLHESHNLAGRFPDDMIIIKKGVQ